MESTEETQQNSDMRVYSCLYCTTIAETDGSAYRGSFIQLSALKVLVVKLEDEDGTL